MVTATSKNNSFICVEEICNEQVTNCQECRAQAEPQIHPLKKVIHTLWINIRLFFETDKWDHIVTLKVGASHYTMKMDEIEKRWRNQQVQ
jgi:hypothetical protein